MFKTREELAEYTEELMKSSAQCTERNAALIKCLRDHPRILLEDGD